MAEQQTQRIAWAHDLEQALGDAEKRSRFVLLDFSAAPM